jgi:hypothetical protein
VPTPGQLAQHGAHIVVGLGLVEDAAAKATVVSPAITISPGSAFTARAFSCAMRKA